MSVIPDTQVCNKCKEILSLNCFGKRKYTKSGYASTCKKCLVIYDKTVNRNRERRLLKMKEWYRNNPERKQIANEKARAAYHRLMSNKKAFEKILYEELPTGYKKCFCCKNVLLHDNFNICNKSKDGLHTYCKSCLAVKCKLYYKNDEQSKIKRREAERKRYYKLKEEDPEKLKLKHITVALRRRERYALNGDKVHISIDLLRKVLERDNNQCLACGSTDNLEIDHIVPVCKGGRTVFDNLQILCCPCNRSKFTKIIDYRGLING